MRSTAGLLSVFVSTNEFRKTPFVLFALLDLFCIFPPLILLHLKSGHFLVGGRFWGIGCRNSR
jgi:hypothetical protein